jgi:hypothetical protein
MVVKSCALCENEIDLDIDKWCNANAIKRKFIMIHYVNCSNGHWSKTDRKGVINNTKWLYKSNSICWGLFRICPEVNCRI